MIAALLAGAVFGALFYLTAPWAIVVKLLCIAGAFMVLHRAGTGLGGLMLGWAWGAGATLSGMGWLYIAMHDVGGLPAWMAGIAMGLFSLLLGVFNGIAGLLAVQLSGSRAGPQRMPVSGITFAACWVLGEWLRTWVLTGLPWMSVGYGFLDTPLAGVASGLGVLGVGAAAVLLSVCAAQSLNRQRFKAVLGAAAVWAVCAVAGQAAYTTPFGSPLSVALLQGNVPQDLKFDPALSMEYIQRYVNLAARSTADLTVMPETALPTLLGNLPDSIVQQLQAAKGVQLIGIAGELDGKYTNRMATPFTPSTGSTQTPWVYDKSHLVPFGEAIPTGFQWFVDLMKMPLSSMGRGAAGQGNLTVKGIEIAPNICYEELFAHEWRAQAGAAQLLLNASNFGWYGDSAALPQHSNIARMRALEFQKPYLSATNNGMTLAVLPTGAVQAALAKNTEGTLRVAVQARAGTTPYAYWGDWGAVALACIALGWQLVRRLRRGRGHEPRLSTV
jgi:apolipoprotein N-acyltransferase